VCPCSLIIHFPIVSEADASPPARLDEVLVLAPFRKDSEFVRLLLRRHGIECNICQDTGDLENCLAEPPGVIVATQEALKPHAREVIADYLLSQPGWSELPIIILLDNRAPHARMRATLAAAWPRSRQVFYQRPVAALELVSGIQSALLARVRQREVRDHIEREMELRRELNHRVKNLLASVFSIFQMTRRRATGMDQLADDFEGRLGALANVHSAVFRAGGETIGISDVVDSTFAPYRADGEDRIVSEGPPLTITKEAGTTLALCLHELVTNALKYGALTTANGCVELHWSISGETDGTFRIEWIENGGPPVEEPSRSGYGTSYIRAALTSLTGTAPAIEYRKQGFQCAAAGPVDRILADPA
jgi:two-component sensor histidine kinase